MILIFVSYAELPVSETALLPDLPKGLLPEDKLKIIFAQRRWQDRYLSLKGYEIAFRLLTENMNIGEFSFTFTETGKPIVSSEKRAWISISHSNERVICVVSDMPVGVDIEKIKLFKQNTMIGILSHILDREEISEINNMTGNKTADFFFELWTAKESAVKLSGEGITSALSHKIRRIDKNMYSMKAKDSQAYIKLFSFEGYCAALCSANKSELDSFTEKNIYLIE